MENDRPDDELPTDPAGPGEPAAPARPAGWIRAHPIRRAAAFAIDLTIVTVICNTADQFVAVPVPGPVMGLLHAAILLGYFLVFHRSPDPVTTPGKRIMKLRLLDTTGGAPSAGRVLGRYGVLAAIFQLDWTGILLWISPARVPGLVPVLLMAAGGAVVVANALFALLDPEARTVHDRLAGTRVRRPMTAEMAAELAHYAQAEPSVAPAPAAAAWRSRFAPVAVLSVVVAVVISLAALGYRAGSFGPGLAAALTGPSIEYGDPARTLEQGIARELGIRADVTVTQGVRWSSGEGKHTYIEIAVSLSFLSADEATITRIAELIAGGLTVDPEQIDRASIHFKSGFPIVTTRSYELTINR